MITTSTVLVFIHTTTPSPCLVLLTSCSCWTNSLPNSCVSPLQTYLWFLSQRQVSFKVCVHCLSCNIIFFLLDKSLISKSMNSSSDFFFRSSWIMENILLSKSISQLSFTLNLLFIRLNKSSSFCKRIIVSLKISFFLQFSVFKSTISPIIRWNDTFCTNWLLFLIYLSQYLHSN